MGIGLGIRGVTLHFPELTILRGRRIVRPPSLHGRPLFHWGPAFRWRRPKATESPGGVIRRFSRQRLTSRFHSRSDVVGDGIDSVVLLVGCTEHDTEGGKEKKSGFGDVHGEC